MNTLMYEHEIEYCKRAIASGARDEVLKDLQMRLKRAEAAIKAAQAEKSAIIKNYVLGFYSPDEENGYLSNWYPCTFQYGKETYNSAIQFMMAQKAALFEDYNTFFKILETSDLSKIKKLGKQVSNYDDAVWSRLRGPMMRRGLRAKFQQNPIIMKNLLATGNKILAECSPHNKIWGIGLNTEDTRIQDPQKWKGQNLTGTVLMEVRSDLKSWLAASPKGIDYINAMDMSPNEIWAMPLHIACQLPKIKKAIDIYAEVVQSTFRIRNIENHDFYENIGPLEDLEFLMEENMGGGYPIAWFYEMKQEIYDIVRFDCC